MHTSSLYWFTLTTRPTSSSQKPLGNPLSNQNQITNTTHQSRPWTPQETHYLWQTTVRVLILNTSRTHNTYWQYNYRNTEDWEKDYTWSNYNWKEYNCNPILLSLENPKLDVNLENLRLNLSNWIFLQTVSYSSETYNKLYMLPKID